jgi:1-acyl-sn-glycerol-3-phosphate acyltransferase
VIHCAASIEFDLPLPEAAAANVTAALHVLDLARDCRNLTSMVGVSTAYVSPHPGDGEVTAERLAPLPRPASRIYASILEGSEDERALLAETGHPNTYTLTKCLAEHLVSERCADVPLTLVRPSIISASLRRPFPGWIDSPAAFALLILSIATGRMRAVIANPRGRVDVVPCDAVAERVVDAAFQAIPATGDSPLIRHAVAGYERSPTLTQCRERIAGFFARNPPTAAGGEAAGLRYLGPDGFRYRYRHWRHHLRRPDARLVAGRLDGTNRLFAYFTSNTFRFHSSVPLDDPGFEPCAYIETVCRGVARHLLDVGETEVSLAGRQHPAPRSHARWATAQPRGSLAIRSTAWLVARVLRRIADRVTFDWRSFEHALEASPPDAPRVIVASHRSYLDFVLVSYLAFARPDLGLAIPHVAAAVEFARIPIIGRILRRLHAFYLVRGAGSEDKELTRQVHELIRAGRTLEFFIEGRRSRSRRFLPAHRGMLRSLQATGETIALLPVAISYERVPEEATFLMELRGSPTPAMRLRDLLGWSWKAWRGRIDLGRVHVACGRPVRLDLGDDVHATSRDVMAELRARTVLTTWHLRAFLECESRALTGIDLAWLRAAVERRGGRVLASRSKHPFGPTLERSLRSQLEPLFCDEAAHLYAGSPAMERHLASIGSVARAGSTAADLADPRLARTVLALFEPVRRAHLAAALRLGAPGDELEIASPRQLLQGQPDIWGPDAESAFEHLGELGILARIGGRYVWGPRAREIEAHRAACARPPLQDFTAVYRT